MSYSNEFYLKIHNNVIQAALYSEERDYVTLFTMGGEHIVIPSSVCKYTMNYYKFSSYKEFIDAIMDCKISIISNRSEHFSKENIQPKQINKPSKVSFL
jgi:hypothetical protein